MILKGKPSVVAFFLILIAVGVGLGGVALIKKHPDIRVVEADPKNGHLDDILSFSEWNPFTATKKVAAHSDAPEIRNFEKARDAFSADFFKYALTDGDNLLRLTDNFLSSVADLKELRTRSMSVASVSGSQSYLSKQLDLTETETRISTIKRIMAADGKIVFLLIDENQIGPLGGKILESRIYPVSSGKLDLDNELTPTPEVASLLARSGYADLDSLALKIKQSYPEDELAFIAINLSGIRRIVNDLGIIEFPDEKMVVDSDNIREGVIKKKDFLKSILFVSRERLVIFSMEKLLSFSEDVGKIIDAGNLQVVLPKEKRSEVSPETNHLSLRPVFTASESSPLRAKVEINTELLSDGTEETEVTLKRVEPDPLRGLENLFVIVPKTVEFLNANNENKRTAGLEGLAESLSVKEFDNIGRIFSFKYRDKMDMLSGRSYRFLYKGLKGADMPVSIKITVSGGYVFKETGKSEYVYESLDSVEELPIVLTLVRL